MGTRAFVSGALMGAGLVYFLDAEQGPARRRRVAKRLGLPASAGSHYGTHYGMRYGDIDGLAAANLRRTTARPSRPAEHAARLAAAALALYGLIRPGAGATLARLLGVGMAALVPASTPSGTARFAERRRTIDIQKSIHIDAPIERVFDFFATYQNIPILLSDVRDVQPLGGGRSRWVIRGPSASAVTWTAVVTERIPNRLLAWRTEPGAVLEHAGVLRLRPEGSGTRIDFRFCYSPPEARAGAALADFFGQDPRARINDDLGRLKGLLETTTRSEVHGEESGT